MHFYQIPSGGDRNFSYLIGCPGRRIAAVVDPSPDPDPVAGKAEALNLNIRYVINTHSHHDHSCGNHRFLKQGGCRLVAHPSNSSADVGVGDGETLPVGSIRLTFLHTPGHTGDSICVQAADELITGDTLFVGKIGGTTDRASARTQFHSLRRLMELPDHTRVRPGHDVGLHPSSTIAEERRTNPFCLRLEDFEDFFWLKQNWADYKREHGIP